MSREKGADKKLSDCPSLPKVLRPAVSDSYIRMAWFSSRMQETPSPARDLEILNSATLYDIESTSNDVKAGAKERLTCQEVFSLYFDDDDLSAGATKSSHPIEHLGSNANKANVQTGHYRGLLGFFIANSSTSEEKRPSGNVVSRIVDW